MRLISRLPWMTGWQVGATGPEAWLFYRSLHLDEKSVSWRIFRAALQTDAKLQSCWDGARVLPAVICSCSSLLSQTDWMDLICY